MGKVLRADMHQEDEDATVESAFRSINTDGDDAISAKDPQRFQQSHGEIFDAKSSK
jgi:hypothetical protein